ncbi:pyruvate dehydrogenase (acetyl-transferring) E1 component subunit alpha [Candidatus Peregrinibacteria bacterium CG11_big_fil_rev_8_21_14_0_20_46_8]|nr:MAG: pyruvate dehydrogenase (acetyl-transferring) E1 component subunit alpha [Candidatus Peregrinibacteria bacterium CG11_big_fil_rev_8_21_14_0_20_46_8]
MPLIPEFPKIDDSMIQVLAPDGTVVREDFLPNWDEARLREVYKEMILIRRADKKFTNLQRTGRSGTYPSMEGQEATQMGMIYGIKRDDWIFPAFRELAACYLHGVPLEKIYLYWMGDEWGSNYEANALPVSIPVGSHPLHAVGTGWAFRLQNKPHITVSFFSDGATSEGALYEAINFAPVVQSRTVFCCQNNGWAISTPTNKQTAAATLAQKAVAGGLRNIRVDGNDIFAMYAVAREAAELARQNIPVFIEAMTYRLGNHTTSDDSGKYRSKEEEEDARTRDPILRLQKYLAAQKIWTPEFAKECEEAADAAISKAVEAAENTKQNPDDIFDYHYEKITPPLAQQKEELKKFL